MSLTPLKGRLSGERPFFSKWKLAAQFNVCKVGYEWIVRLLEQRLLERRNRSVDLPTMHCNMFEDNQTEHTGTDTSSNVWMVVEGCWFGLHRTPWKSSVDQKMLESFVRLQEFVPNWVQQAHDPKHLQQSSWKRKKMCCKGPEKSKLQADWSPEVVS